MARYLVGNSSQAWDFNEALKQVKDGDTIELDGSFILETASYITINKSITIESDEKTKSANFKGQLYITDGAKVTFSNLWMATNGDKTVLYVDKKSSITLNTCVLENLYEKNTKVLAYIIGNSEVFFNDVQVYSSIEHYKKKVKIVNGKAEFKNCALEAVLGENAYIKIENSTIKSEKANCLELRQSELDMKHVTIEGAQGEDINSPAVWLYKTKVLSESTTVSQGLYSSAVFVNEDSSFDSKNDHFTSLEVRNSRVFFENTTIDTIFILENKAYARSKGSLHLLGTHPEKVDLFIKNYSALIAEEVQLYRVINPNLKVIDNSFLKVDDIILNGDDVESYMQRVDDTSSFIKPFYKEDEEEIVEVADSEEDIIQENRGEQALKDLDEMIGLTSVKKEIKKMLNLVDFNNQRIAQGLKPEKQSLHSVFMGNPGTGKTTVARLIGDILFENGALSGEEFVFVEATESDLISSNVGGTAEQTKALLEKAKGGILFIDEAYTLNKGDSSVNFGQEAINTILKYMEDYRDEIMIIFAGYTKEMEQFLQTNPGLASRVPNKFIFEDYSANEIIQMGEQILTEGQYVLENEEYYKNSVSRAYNSSLDRSNGRWIRNFNEQLCKALANRYKEEGTGDVTTITKGDIEEVLNRGRYIDDENKEDALGKLNNLIGIAKVKKQVQEFISLSEVNKKREEQGQMNMDFSLHALYLGNPGTGKTTVARIVGELLYQKDIINQNKFIEVSRSDLVAGYVGQTALKTREVLESALGGVLFIDEAYTLSNGHGSGNDFGKEALDEILKFMEDHRRDIVIIFAGYDKEMMEFLQINSGLTSRIPNIFNFEDYTVDEICQIGLLGLDKQGYSVDVDQYAETVTRMYNKTNDNSNGRWVRNLNERLIRTMSTRLTQEGSDDFNTITHDDILNLGDY